MADQANNAQTTAAVEETISVDLDGQGHMVGTPRISMHPSRPASPAPATPAPAAPAVTPAPAPATPAKRVITQKDHVPFVSGLGGEFVLLSSGIRVSAALYEESVG